MTKLSPVAESALKVLREQHLNYMLHKSTIEEELKKELQARLSSAKHERNVALRIAAEAGVPKTQLGKAIGTSNYRTVQEILAETESTDSSRLDTRSAGIVVEAHSENGLYQITLSNFGDNSISGQAMVQVDREGNLDTVSGDQFVVPQIYRNDYREYVIDKIQKLS